MTKNLLFSFLALFLFWEAAPAYGCSCAPLPPVKEALASADAVFAGKVIQRKELGDWQAEFTFFVDQAWKGVCGQQVRVVEATSSAMCGYGFEVGREYLVYTHRASDGTLSASICSRTKPLEQAGEDLKELED